MFQRDIGVCQAAISGRQLAPRTSICVAWLLLWLRFLLPNNFKPGPSVQKIVLPHQPMEGNYVHRPLSRPQNIRVLKLEPAEELKDPLVCYLEEIDPEAAEYDALSYSWAMEDGKDGKGDSSPTESMLLDGCRILIGQNLRDALRRLRRMPNLEQVETGDRKQPCRIWADALCINQRDDLEKSVQVATMASIYRNAAMVIAWLGEGDEDDNNLAFKAIQCLAVEAAIFEPTKRYRALFYDHMWTSNNDHRLADKREQCSACRNMELEPGQETRLGWAVETLTHRRYFNRRWVVQEVATRHTNQVMFQWGAREQAGDPLRFFEMFFINNSFRPAPIEFQPAQYQLGTSPAWSFEEWMQFCALKCCLDPRDVVYAVLGCVKEAPMRPDYTKSVHEVYADFTKYLLEKRCLVTILRNAARSVISTRSSRSEPRRLVAHDWPTWLLNPGLIPFKLHESPAKCEAMWDYALPSMDGTGLVLSCHMAYQGTVTSKRLVCSSVGDQRWSYGIIWEAQQERDGTGLCFHDELKPAFEDSALLGSTARQNGTDLVAVLEGENQDSRYLANLEIGDVLCDFGPCESREGWSPSETASLILHRTARPGFWEIAGRFYFEKHYYCGPDRPEERRLFHLV